MHHNFAGMKNFLVLLIISLLFSVQLQAQRAYYKPQAHQVEVQLVGANFIPALGNIYDSPVPFSTNFGNMVRYTYHYSLSHGFRFGAGYRTANFADETGNYIPVIEYEAQKRDLDFGLGYIYKHHRGIVQYFVGADLRYSRSQIQQSGISGITPAGVPFSETFPSNNAGISGTLGYRMFLNTYVSLALEVNPYYMVTHLGESGPSETRTYEPTPEHEAGINTGLTLSVHFVKMKKRCTCPKM